MDYGSAENSSDRARCVLNSTLSTQMPNELISVIFYLPAGPSRSQRSVYSAAFAIAFCVAIFGTTNVLEKRRILNITLDISMLISCRRARLFLFSDKLFTIPDVF